MCRRRSSSAEISAGNGRPANVITEEDEQAEARYKFAKRFRDSFQSIPSEGETLEFWYGERKTKREIESRFWLSSEQVTNELVRLYDPLHGTLYGENYSRYSPYSDRGAAIYLNWYDADDVFIEVVNEFIRRKFGS